MKKIISSILISSLISIPMSSNGFIKACPPRKILELPLPMVTQPPKAPNALDDLFSVDIPGFIVPYDRFELDDVDIFSLPEQNIPVAEIPVLPQQVYGIDTFDYNASTAYWLLNERFGKLTKEKLVKLINKVREFLEKKRISLPVLFRDAKRHKSLLYKYLEENLGQIARVLPYIRL